MTSTDTNDLTLPGVIELAACQPPGVDGGTYSFIVSQEVTGPDGAAGATYTQSYTVTVAGPRFTLDPAQVVSVYPPAGGRGRYLDVLPQIVIERVTLPWERTLWADQPVTSDARSPVPFLAVLVLDGPDTSQASTVNELIHPAQGSGVIGPANVTLDSGEAPTDQCRTLDIDATTFLQVAPLVTELPYLAHCRKMDPSSAPTTAQWNADPWYAIVTANRLPLAATATNASLSTAYLVSLEGFGDLLTSRQLPSGIATVRLAVLASWQFTDDSVSDPDFAALAAALDMSAPGLSLPPPGESPGGSGAAGGEGADPAEVVSSALNQGYVPLNYTTRFGETAVSWYRAPLTPVVLAAEPTTTYSCVNAALRFDPQLGMLDLSYAAAWQLGRLLAIADAEFAPALMAWRRANQLNLQTLATNIQLAERLPGLPQARELSELSDRHRMPRLVGRWLAETLGPALLGPDLASPPTRLGRRRSPRAPIADPEEDA